MFPLRAIIAVCRAYPSIPLRSVSERVGQRWLVDYDIIPEGWVDVESPPQLEIYWRAK